MCNINQPMRTEIKRASTLLHLVLLGQLHFSPLPCFSLSFLLLFSPLFLYSSTPRPPPSPPLAHRDIPAGLLASLAHFFHDGGHRATFSIKVSSNS